jgi:hypothetical protein
VCLHRGFPAVPWVGPSANIFYSDYDATEQAPDGSDFITCTQISTPQLAHDAWSWARAAANLARLLP